MADKINLRRCLITSMLLLLLFCSSAMAKIIYVDDDAAGANNGSSWIDAYNYLQDALADANTAEKPVEIHVAQGVYKPDQGAGITPGDRRAEFQLINGVAILGGFAGVGATEPDARYIEAYETILSGDLNGDDADVDNPDELHDEPTRAENSICIVSGGNGIWTTIPGKIDETAVLDGVTITAGSHCMRNFSGNPTVSNCTFTNASKGIYNLDSDQRLSNCTFEGHSFEAVYHTGVGLLTLTDCLFIGNKAGIWSGFLGELTLQDCTFIGDRTMESREAIYLRGENLKLYDCKFINNISSGIAFISANINKEFIAENCTFSGNVGDLIDNSGGGNLFISNCIFTGNIGVPIEHSRKRLVITNCLFAGNRGDRRSGLIHSDDQYTTIRNCTFSNNSSEFIGSVLNLEYGGKISNCIFWGNNSPVIENRHGEIVMNYCNFEGGWPGEGNIDVDPYFVSPGYWDQNGTPDDMADDFWVEGDYHLQSQAGHWDQRSQMWVQDNLTSSCIDAGDPNGPLGTEPFPNGGRINMGAYGAFDKASKSYFGGPVCETIIAGDINGDGIVDDEDLAILNSHWMMRAEDLVNKPPTVRLIEPQDGDRFVWPGPAIFIAEASDPDGQVDEVWFYAQYNKTSGGRRTFGYYDSDGSDGWEEREFNWPDDVDFGEWIVWAEATDNDGEVGISPEIKVILYRPL